MAESGNDPFPLFLFMRRKRSPYQVRDLGRRVAEVAGKLAA